MRHEGIQISITTSGFNFKLEYDTEWLSGLRGIRFAAEDCEEKCLLSRHYGDGLQHAPCLACCKQNLKNHQDALNHLLV